MDEDTRPLTDEIPVIFINDETPEEFEERIISTINAQMEASRGR